MRTILASTTLLFALSAVTIADDWTEFRGSRGDGRSAAKNLPTKWSEKENIKWKVEVHDKGWSSPVVIGKHVWLTTATAKGDKLYVVCLDRDSGKTIHDKLLFEVKKPADDPYFKVYAQFNSYASPTPAVNDGLVYVHFGSIGTVCLKEETGEIVWKRDDLECYHHRGAASSPIVFENNLILTFDGFDVQYLVALDKKTGKTVWKTDRKFFQDGGDGDRKKGYSTPAITMVDGKPQLVSSGASASAAYDPRTGAEIWRVTHGGMNASARPVFAEGMAFVTASDGGKQLVAVRLGGKGNVTTSHVAWMFEKGAPNRSSLLAIGDKLYMVNTGGIALCLSAKDGKELGRVRLDSKGAKFSASPVEADGKIYVFDDIGLGFVLSATPEMELLSANRLDKGCMASPAVSGGALFVRTHTHLYRIETTK